MPRFVKEMLFYNVFFSWSGWSWGTRRRASGWTGPKSPTSGGTSYARPKLLTLGEMSSLSRWGLKVNTLFIFFSVLCWTLFEWGLKFNKQRAKSILIQNETGSHETVTPSQNWYGKHQLQFKNDSKTCSMPDLTIRWSLYDTQLWIVIQNRPLLFESDV